MRFEEKLRKQMLLKGFNQQKLARSASVSDSEVSRILAGRSLPGLENAIRLARAVGVSLDYLADDAVNEPAGRGSTAAEEIDPTEREILEAAREIGLRSARRVLETVCELGYETAIRRLLEIKPTIEIVDPARPAPSVAVQHPDRRSNSA